MKRSCVVYFCFIFVILLVNAAGLANAIDKGNVLGSKKDVKATGAEVESSKPRWFRGGYYWGRPGLYFGGGGGRGGGGGGGGCGGNGGGPGGGAGGCGGSPGQPGWGGRGGKGGGAGGYPRGTPPSPGNNNKRPGKRNAGRSSGSGGAGAPGAADGGQDGSGSHSMPNPNNPRCGNIQMVQVPNGYLISYDCDNCNYQYTIDYSGMTTGYGSVTCF